jgi:phospholipid-binding lipoprotein MlaA
MLKRGTTIPVMVLGLALQLAGCAAPTPEAVSANDPFEPFNRRIFQLNHSFNNYVVLPVADIYIYHLPAVARTGLHNFISNLDLPVTFANDALQGKFHSSAETLGRLALNSTLGLGGLIDVAADAGLPAHTSDFGQTLALWGVGEGPFLVLPILGPEPPRDLVGDAVDVAMDPLAWVPPGFPLGDRIGIVIGLHIANPFEPHARNIYLRQELEKDSLDPYATMRSAWRQSRAREIAGKPGNNGESFTE